MTDQPQGPPDFVICVLKSQMENPVVPCWKVICNDCRQDTWISKEIWKDIKNFVYAGYTKPICNDCIQRRVNAAQN